MKFVILNGSPKKSQSATAAIIEAARRLTGSEATCFQAVDLFRRTETETAEEIAQIIHADVLLIAFPLYVDCLPMPLIRVMQRIEAAAQGSHAKLKVFAVSQCGFFEPEQNETALRMIQHFCDRSGFAWQFGVGIGAGVLLGRAKDISKGMTSPIYTAIESLCRMIVQDSGEKRENVYITPSMPRFLYQFGGNLSWKQQAKVHGAAGKLRSAPFNDKRNPS